MSTTYEGTITASGSVSFTVIPDGGISPSDRPSIRGRRVKVTLVDTPESVLSELIAWWDRYAEGSNMSLSTQFPKGSEIITRARALTFK